MHSKQFEEPFNVEAKPAKHTHSHVICDRTHGNFDENGPRKKFSSGEENAASKNSLRQPVDMNDTHMESLRIRNRHYRLRLPA